MSTELAKAQTPDQVLGIVTKTYDTLPPLARGWLTLAAVKVNTFGDLQKSELAIQGTLADIDTLIPADTEGHAAADLNAALENVQKIIATAKQTYSEMEAQRLGFTNDIRERLIDPAMDFERRSKVLLEGAGKKELAFRIICDKKGKEGQAKQNEEAALKTHIINEYFRIANKYQNDLATKIVEAYATALRGKTPVKELPAYKKAIVGFLKEVELDDFVVFNLQLVTKEEAGAIFQSVKPYTGEDHLQEAIAKLDTQFAMYAQDLKNAEVAIKKQNELLQETIANNDKETEIEQATNTLTGQAGVVQQTGKATVKRKMDVVEENTDQWAVNVLAAFIKNWQACRGYLAVKTWSKLSIGQMATALGKLATDQNKTSVEKSKVYDGLTLVEILK